MPENTNNEDRAKLALEAFNQAEATYKASEVASMLAAGEAVAVWCEATSQEQGDFPVPKLSRWASKGAISTLHSAFKHWGLNVETCTTRVDQYRKVYGSKVSTLTALNGARKGNVREWQRDSKAKTTEREARQAQAQARAEQAKANPNAADAPMRSNSADEIGRALIGLLADVSADVFGEIVEACKVRMERDQAAERTPYAADAVRPTRAA